MSTLARAVEPGPTIPAAGSAPSTVVSTPALSGKSAATSAGKPTFTPTSTAASTLPSSGATTPHPNAKKEGHVVHKQDEPKNKDAKPKPQAAKQDMPAPPTPKKEDKKPKKKRVPCPPHLCTLVPVDVPAPECTQAILHPRKDVFVLKVAKVGPNGDRRCRMELELVTPKSHEKTPPYRLDTRETQCDPECSCCCSKEGGKRKK